MNRLAAIVSAVFLCSPTAIYAQDSLLGKYSGSITLQGTNSPNFNVGITVLISSVEDGVVKGVATMGGQSCRGDYPFRGTFKDDVLAVRSAKGGAAGDCVFGFRGTHEGNKLNGKIGQNDVVLAK